MMKRMLYGTLGITLTLASTTAMADLRVVVTVPNMGMLAREICGDAVDVRVLAPPDRDPHYLDARPSMMAALRRSDLVVSVGAELEIGWLPAAIQGANNRRVQPGRPGYFEAARKVELIGTGKPADRALGDVHPQGNPHIYMDPERMAAAAHALAERLGALDRDRADQFKANAERFAQRVAERMQDWRARAKGAPGVVTFHEDIDYLAFALDVPVHGYLEPLPGIPPTARHLSALVTELTDRQGVIWTVDFQDGAAGEYLARNLGWDAFQLPSQVPVDGAAAAYFAMIDAWVDTLHPAE